MKSNKSLRGNFLLLLLMAAIVFGAFTFLPVPTANAQACYQQQCTDVWVSHGYWAYVWSGYWTYIWSGYWNFDWNSWSWYWVDTGSYWQWIDTSQWVWTDTGSGYERQCATIQVSCNTPGAPCLYNGIYYGGPNYCCNDSQGYLCNNLYVYDANGVCSYPPLGTRVTHPEFGVQCPIPCVSNQGQVCNTNACGVSGGTIQCNGSCFGWNGYSIPDLPSGYGSACNFNTCGSSGGIINCSGTCSGGVPDLPAGYGSACNTNACGVYGGTIGCSGACSGSTPALPAGFGSACTSAVNSCGQTNSGIIGCSGSCSATTTANPAGYGSACTSAANSCGMTNSGIIGCSGCSATTPSESLCNSPPTAGGLGVTQGDYCGASSPPIFLSWQFSDPNSGDTQRSYRVQADNNAGFPSPEVDTGQVSSSSTQYSPAGLLYNTTFYWRVMVWDNHGAVSSWTNGSSFATASHQYPTANFTWAPANPGELQNTQFTDTSQVFGGASRSAWSWTFQNGSPATSTQQNPSVQFTPTGIKQVILRITDSSGYSCQISQNVNVQLPFPDWQEISPF